MHNLNNNEKKKDNPIVTAVTSKATNWGRRVGGGPRKK
jgi:hypothetical protein